MHVQKRVVITAQKNMMRQNCFCFLSELTGIP